jgi:hypothetical protein
LLALGSERTEVANIFRVTFTWNGFTGAPGFTNMFYDDSTGTAQQAADITRAFLVGCLTQAPATLPTGCSVVGPTSVDTVEPATGTLINTTAITQPAQINGTATGNFASSTGACVTWLTAGIVAGHRVRGRTFLVPLAAAAFTSTGGLAPAYQTALSAAVTTLLAASPDLVVWRRPISQAAGGGGTNAVLAARVPSKSAVLTSRRD